MPRLIRTASLLLFIFAAVGLGFAQEKNQEKKQTKKEPPVAATTTIIKSLPEYDPAAWKEYKSDKGGFSILFPGTPQEKSEKVTSDGREIVIRLLQLNELAIYSVMYLADPMLPAGNSEATRKRFDFSVNQAIAMFQGVALEQKEITLDNHPGRALMLRLPDGLTMRLRFYIVGKQLYQLMITTPKEDGVPDARRRFYEATASKFLDSFKLTPTASASSVGVLGPVGPVAGGSVRGGAPVSKPKNLPRAQVSGGVLNGKAISKPAPAYPAAAVKERVEGVVSVAIVVDEEGKVMAAEAVGGPELLREASVAAALKSRFSITRLAGQPVRVSGIVTYNFVLR